MMYSSVLKITVQEKMTANNDWRYQLFKIVKRRALLRRTCGYSTDKDKKEQEQQEEEEEEEEEEVTPTPTPTLTLTLRPAPFKPWPWVV